MAAFKGKIMDIFEQSRPTTLSPYRMHIFALMMALTVFSLLYGPGTGHKSKQPAVQSPPTLVASPNDPLMIQAIKFTQARKAEDGPWGGAPKKQGPTITFDTAGGPLVLSWAEIEQANTIYPGLVRQAEHANR